MEETKELIEEAVEEQKQDATNTTLSLIHISEPTRP